MRILMRPNLVSLSVGKDGSGGALVANVSGSREEWHDAWTDEDSGLGGAGDTVSASGIRTTFVGVFAGVS